MSDQKEEEERWRGGAEFAKLLFGLVFSLGEYFSSISLTGDSHFLLAYFLHTLYPNPGILLPNHKLQTKLQNQTLTGAA